VDCASADGGFSDAGGFGGRFGTTIGSSGSGGFTPANGSGAGGSGG
jgi:hypothetical protein